MKTPLDGALEAASRGWKVFPIVRNRKVPPKGFTDWEHRASSDPQQINAWAEQYPGCNWAVACGASNLIVLDVDVKEGKPGLKSLKAYQQQHGPLPDTEIVQTPSGGLHYYFTGQCASDTHGKIGPGLDVKSCGGYVLLPGSTTKAGRYERLEF